jgi:hypothetical protein
MMRCLLIISPFKSCLVLFLYRLQPLLPLKLKRLFPWSMHTESNPTISTVPERFPGALSSRLRHKTRQASSTKGGYCCCARESSKTAPHRLIKMVCKLRQSGSCRIIQDDYLSFVNYQLSIVIYFRTKTGQRLAAAK